MVNHSVLRLSSVVPGSPSGGGSSLETEGDCHAGDAPPAQEVSSAPFEQTDRAPDDAIPESVVDVALTLVLSEIAQQARSITNATGSAVLLIRGGVPVCRSTSGATARDASAYLSECSGLAWRNGAPQHCQDVETDSRFDLASFRRLGIRSFLIVPVRDDKKAVVAIVQTFSARAQGFSDRDLLALLGFGRHIVDHLEAAERSFASIPKSRGKAEPEMAPGRTTLSRFAQPFNTVKVAFLHERLTLVLGVLIIILAILLGWTIGRSERNSAHQNRGAPASPVANHAQISVTPAEPNSTGVVQVANPSTEPVGPTNASEVDTKNDQSSPKIESHKNLVKSRQSSVSKLMASDSASRDLVVFESGKQVFTVRSPQSQAFSDAQENRESKSGKPKSEDQETPVSVGEDVAAGHLLQRIEPDYSESAREQRLQGTVVLNINVGKDGTVHSLSRVAGDSQLALLAAKAVRQWKFAPLVRDGAAVSFESQVTLSFALP
jgi:TonB family protein